MVDRNGIANGARGCAMTKLGCAFTSCGAPTSRISSGRRGGCAEVLREVINMKPQPKRAANQCGADKFCVFLFLSEAWCWNCVDCNPITHGPRRLTFATAV